MGFEQCQADICLFVRRNRTNNKSPTYIVLYVDDLLIGCKSDAEADTMFNELSEHFTVKSLELCAIYFGHGGELLTRRENWCSNSPNLL